MGAEISESADSRLRAVGHPSPLAIEPAAECAAVTVTRPDPGDLAEEAFLDLLLQKANARVATSEIAGLEGDLVVFEQLLDLHRLLRIEAHRLLDEDRLAGAPELADEFEVPVGLAAYDETGKGS